MRTVHAEGNYGDLRLRGESGLNLGLGVCRLRFHTLSGVLLSYSFNAALRGIQLALSKRGYRQSQVPLGRRLRGFEGQH